MIHFFLNYKKFIPNAHVDHIFDVDFTGLFNQGIKLLLIDLDNTLIPYDQSEPNDALHKFFKDLKAIGFETIIVSNNHFDRIKCFADKAEVSFVSSAKKPTKIGFKKALKKTSRRYQKEEICVIGDQLMTDIFGAKRLGLMAILVTPIKKKSEKWYTKLNRIIEEKMFAKIKKKEPTIYYDLRLEDR